MPVHPDSVLSTKIQDFNEAFYLKLADMEYYTYENSTRTPPPEYMGDSEVAGYEEYSPRWELYSNALVDYLEGSIDRTDFRDFIFAIYGFLARYEMQGVGSTAKREESNGATIFRINGLIDTVMGYPIDHYDDYTFPYTDPEEEEPVPSTADNLSADTSHASSAFGPDASTVDSLRNYFINQSMDSSMADIFGDAPPITGEFTPQIAWDIIFDELEWKWIIEFFGWDITVPPRPEDSEPEPFDPNLSEENP